MKRFIYLFLMVISITGLSQQTDSIIDIRDDQVYSVVKIDQDWWMQENLNVGSQIDSLSNQLNNSTIEKYCYRNYASMCEEYGGLYQWDELMDYNLSDPGDYGTTRGICPVGWHIPTKTEYQSFITYLGGLTIAGGKIKEAGFDHWNAPNTGATNESGFTAIASGQRHYNGYFDRMGLNSFFFSSTESSGIYANTLFTWHSTAQGSVSSGQFKTYGYSVRCLKDSVLFSYLNISDLQLNTITSLEFTDDNTSDTIVIMNTGAGKTINITDIQTISSSFQLSKTSASLAPGDSVHLVIRFDPAINSKLYIDNLRIYSNDTYQPILPFPMTGVIKYDSIIDVRDDQEYKTVKIGNQLWMQENLNVGDWLNSSNYMTDNGTIERLCYGDNQSNCDIYGGLYEWEEMMDYQGSDNANPGTTQGICPIGWHIPTASEWNELVAFLGGQLAAGGPMKETGLDHWSSPNTGATNESGFTGLPGGYRYDLGEFDDIYGGAYIWTATNFEGVEGFYRSLSGNDEDCTQYTTDLTNGLSVRCIRDHDQYGNLSIRHEDLTRVSTMEFLDDQEMMTIIIANQSAGKTVNISSIHTDNPGFRLGTSSAVLAPGDSIHLVIQFDPPAKEIYYDNLSIVSDNSSDPLITFPLYGTFPLEIAFTDSTNITCNGFDDGTATVTPSVGNPPYTYLWNDDLNTTDPIVTGLKPGIYYTVVVTDNKGRPAEDSIMLTEPDVLVIQSDFTDSICKGSSIGYINLDPAGGTAPYEYLWTTAETTSGIADLEPGNYGVRVTDVNGCTDTTGFLVDSIVPYPDENICIVTVDFSTGNNVVVWERTPDEGIAYYNVYREDNLIATFPYSDLSVFVDDGVDPETRPYLYKISVVDTCGNESAQSKYHKPHFLQYVSSEGGVNLSWDEYQVEGEVVEFDSYSLYRGSTESGLAPLEENIPIVVSVFTDTDTNALKNRYYYRVAGILTNPCTPTGVGGKKADAGPYSHSMSNLEDNRLQVVQNEAPTDITMDDNNIYENLDIGTLVGRFSTTDPNVDDSHVYTLVSGTGDTDNGSFTIIGDSLLSGVSFDYETKSSYNVRVRTTDTADAYIEKQFTVAVNDVNEGGGNMAPTDITMDNSTIDEDQPSGTLVGSFTTIDPDLGDEHTYSLVSGDGSTNNISFMITGDSLLSAEKFDYESKVNYTIRVKSTDNGTGNLYFEKQFMVTVTDLIEDGFNDVTAKNLKIYPNPFNNTTIIKFSNTEGNAYTLYIVDLAGKVCRIVSDINSSEYELEKGDLKPGLYFVELRGERLYRSKIVVE